MPRPTIANQWFSTKSFGNGCFNEVQERSCLLHRTLVVQLHYYHVSIHWWIQSWPWSNEPKVWTHTCRELSNLSCLLPIRKPYKCRPIFGNNHMQFIRVIQRNPQFLGIPQLSVNLMVDLMPTLCSILSSWLKFEVNTILVSDYKNSSSGKLLNMCTITALPIRSPQLITNTGNHSFIHKLWMIIQCNTISHLQQLENTMSSTAILATGISRALKHGTVAYKGDVPCSHQCCLLHHQAELLHLVFYPASVASTSIEKRTSYPCFCNHTILSLAGRHNCTYWKWQPRDILKNSSV